MTTLTLSPDALDLFRLCHRAGDHAYLWGHNGDSQSNGISRWFRTGEAPAVFNSNHNNYFGVNPTTTPGNQYQRAKKGVRDVAAKSVFYAEIDDKDHGGTRGAARMVLEARIASGAIPRPTVTIDSGGGVQAYWGLQQPLKLDTDEQREHADRLQKRWIAHTGGDDGAKDAARVLRVPGTLNFKYDPPRPVEVIEADYSRLYTLDELEALLPPEPPAKARPTRQTASTPAAPVADDDRTDLDMIAEITSLLQRLKPERADNYNTWLNVGMICKDELGIAGFYLWKAWAQKSSKYEPGCCEDKWPTFTRTTGPDRVTLGSLKRWADEDAGEFKHETGGVLDENERRQLQAYKERDVQQQRILNMDAPLSAKAVWIGMLPSVEAASILVENKDDHSGSVAVNYGNFAAIMKTSKTTVKRAVDIGEQSGLWRKDPEHVETKAGYDIQPMRLDLQPAFFRPELAQPIEQKPRGGARPGAGRKPKCADCPPGTHVIKKTTVEYICRGCGQPIDAEPPRYEVMPDAAPLPAEFKHETGGAADEPATKFEPAAEIKHETGYTNGSTSVSCLKKTHDVDAARIHSPDTSSPHQAVPPHIEETFDLTMAISAADKYSPPDELGRFAFKRALKLLHERDADGAAAQLPGIKDPQAYAIVAHLAARHAGQAVTA